MPLLRVCAVYGSPELFVRSLYNVLLRRDPDPGGFAEKLRTLRRTGNRIELIRGFLSSPEYALYPLSANSLVEDLFRSYFGRPPVAGEDDLDFWIQRAAILTRADLATEFKAFAEAALSWQVPGGRLARAWSGLLDVLLGRLTWRLKLDALRDLNARILALSEKQFADTAEPESTTSRPQAEWQSTMSRLQEEGIRRIAEVLAQAQHHNGAEVVDQLLPILSLQQRHVENTQMELQSELLGQVQSLQEQVSRTALAVDRLSEELQVALAEKMQSIELQLAALKTDHATSMRELMARSADDALSARIGEPVDRVRPVTAHFLNWAIGIHGYYAQRRAFFNHSNASVLHENGTVETRLNSRILEVPFAHAAMADLSAGSVVIDVGSNESLLAMELAVAGFQVYSVDFRGYPLQHPRLITVEDSVLHWAGPAQPVDAIFSISTIEHIGLPAYGGTDAALDGDLLAMKRFRSWLRPGGLLVFTAPFGAPQTTDFERTYGPAQLETLLEGFSVETRDFLRKSQDGTWTKVSCAAWPLLAVDDQEMVILVKAKLTA